MKKLRDKQSEILNFILHSIAESGRFPSFREIGSEFGLTSVATVAQHLNALVEKGQLIRDGRKLMPLPGLRRDLGVPILGRVAAGEPISAIENLEGHLSWDDFGKDETFAVRVVGDSMINEGIIEGDFAIVQPSDAARNGDLVVAYLGEDQEVTIKRYKKFKDRVELEAANPRYRNKVIWLPDRYFRIAGKVVGIVRRV